VRAQSKAHRLQAQIRTAALVGNRETVAADTQFRTADACNADRTRTDDHNPAVGTAMRAHACRHRVARVDRLRKRMAHGLQLFGKTLAAVAGNADTGAHRRNLVRRQIGFGDGTAKRGRERLPKFFEPEPRGRRPGKPEPEHIARIVFDARTAARPAAVDADEKRARHRPSYSGTRRMAAPQRTSLRARSS